MIKQIISIGLIIILLIPSVVKVSIYADFKINQETIAKFLCEKRDQPITECGGSCVLKKSLDFNETGEDSTLPFELKQRIEIPLPQYQVTKIGYRPEVYNSGLYVSYFRISDYSSDFYHSVFRPPIFA